MTRAAVLWMRAGTALAVGLFMPVSPRPAAAERVRFDVGTEFDSNVHRLQRSEVTDTSAPSEGWLLRLGLLAAGKRASGRWDAVGQVAAQTRHSLQSDFTSEESALAAARFKLRRKVDEDASVGLSIDGFDYRGLRTNSVVAAQRVLDLAALAVVGDATSQTGFKAGLEAYAASSSPELGYYGRYFEAGWGRAWTDENNPRQLELDVAYRLAFRHFEGPARWAPCRDDATCAATSTDGRQDVTHTLDIRASYTAGFYGEIAYALARQASTHEAYSSWRHRVTAGALRRLAPGWYAAARVRVSFDRYPDGDILANPFDASAVGAVEADNRNELLLQLSYRVSRRMTAEVMGCVWQDGWGGGDVQYRRGLVYVGAAWQLGE